MSRDLDLRLYAIVDVGADGPLVGLEAIELALTAGVTALQVRGKECPPRRLWQYARELSRLCRRHRTGLVINDRPDLAAAAGADGVHLGQCDFPASLARRIWPRLKVGVSVHNGVELRNAERAGVDYVAAGSLYPTGSKNDAVPIDHELFRKMALNSSLPLVGIGGITPELAGEVARMGAAGVAVISGLWQSRDVSDAAARYRLAFP